MLTFEAEPLSSLQARYPAALTPTYDALEVEFWHQLPPSSLRRHVFDFQNGIRLIVSHDDLRVLPEKRAACGLPRRVGVHLSGSVEHGGALEEQIRCGLLSPDGFCEMLIRAWQLLSGSAATPELIGFSRPKGIPHFIVPDQP